MNYDRARVCERIIGSREQNSGGECVQGACVMRCQTECHEEATTGNVEERVREVREVKRGGAEE